MLPLTRPEMGYADQNLAPGEMVVFRARYHWVIYRTGLLLAVLAILLGAAALYARQTSPASGVARPVSLIALAFLAMALLVLALRWLRTAPDEFVVTSRRVMRRVGLVSREIEQAPLEKIQDITVQQGGLARLLGYGTVVLETASERGTLIFPEIARPEAFRNAVWGQAPGAGGRPAASSVAAASPAAGDRLRELENLRQQGLVSDEEYAAKRREILSHV